MKKTYYIAFIIIFMVVATAPFWGIFFKEKEKLTKFSPNKVTTYINRNHGFSDLLSKTYLKFSEEMLKTNPMSADAIVGFDGWLFLGNNYNNEFDKSLGIDKIDTTAIRLSCEYITSIKQVCDSLDIPFYFAIAPNKSSIYPEYLPLRPNHRIRDTELLVKMLSENSNIPTIDLGVHLPSEKATELVYYKTDSHWNKFGGYLGSKYLAEVLAKDFPIDLSFFEEEINVVKQKHPVGDLARMLKMDCEDYEVSVVLDSLNISPLIKAEEETKQVNYPTIHVKNENCKNALNGVMYRDSFFGNMVDYFSYANANTTYIRASGKKANEIQTEIINLETKPDYIVLEIVERNITDIIKY